MSDALHDDTLTAGRKLAIELLREARACNEAGEFKSSWCIEARYRKPGQPQQNIAARFLAALDGKPRAAEGFASVLTDVLSSGGSPEVLVYLGADRQLRARERRST